MIAIRDYIDANGRVPYRNWLVALDAGARARVVTAVLRMQQGNFSAAKTVGSGVLELRLDFGPGYRVYFGKDGDRVVILLAGGTKKRQQTDIEAAHLFWSDYKKRKKVEE